MEADHEYLFSLAQNSQELKEIQKVLELTTSSSQTTNKPIKKPTVLHEYHKKISKELKKNINATIWLAENFQLQIQHLLPILEILSSFSSNIGHFKDFLSNNFMKEANLFPIKAIIPLVYTLNAVVSFQNFKF